MTPLIRDAPDGLRCEADLNAARIQLHAPASRGRWLVAAAMFVIIPLTVGSVAGISSMLLAALTMVGCFVWLLATRHRLSIVLNSHILDVQRSRFGAHYRIPLVDISTVRLLDIHGRRCRLSLEMADDRIEIGQGFTPSELAWLASVVRASVKAAAVRPERRTGTPDEIPAQLAAIKKTRQP